MSKSKQFEDVPSVFSAMKYPAPTPAAKAMSEEQRAAREMEVFKIWQDKQRDIMKTIQPFMDSIGRDMKTIIESSAAPMEARMRLVGLYAVALMAYQDLDLHPEDGLPFLVDKLLMDTEDLDIIAENYE